jgi:hypothetical protein
MPLINVASQNKRAERLKLRKSLNWEAKEELSIVFNKK